MEKKKLNKLTLNKESISNLDRLSQIRVRGGNGLKSDLMGKCVLTHTCDEVCTGVCPATPRTEMECPSIQACESASGIVVACLDSKIDCQVLTTTATVHDCLELT